MSSDIEDYSRECEELERGSKISIETQSAYFHEMKRAEPFWRKLAMKYREVLKDVAAQPYSDSDITSLFLTLNQRSNDVLALTRKDLE